MCAGKGTYPSAPARKAWHLYAKWPGQKRFAAVDYRNGVQVANLIRASIFSDIERDAVEKDLTSVREQNPGMTWEWRAVKGG